MKKIESRLGVSLAAMVWLMAACVSPVSVRTNSGPNEINSSRSSTSLQESSALKEPPVSAPSRKERALKKTGYAFIGIGGALLVGSIFLAAFTDHGVSLPYPGQCTSKDGLLRGECLIDARPIYIPGLILGTGILGTGIGLTIRFR